MTACPKMNVVRDPAYRRSAKGRECDAPGCGAQETVMLCHINIAGNFGRSMKAGDDESLFLCQKCHDEFDGRIVGLDNPADRALWIVRNIVIPLRRENYRRWKADR